MCFNIVSLSTATTIKSCTVFYRQKVKNAQYFSFSIYTNNKAACNKNKQAIMNKMLLICKSNVHTNSFYGA